ncbi:S8 family serine peptidase [Myxococcota bacterium]|nr:S8 family serine peptidase [Myxococcota bacterium]
MDSVRSRHLHLERLRALAIVAAVGAACSQDAPKPAFTYVIDAALTERALPELGGRTRPVAQLADATGAAVSFVADELLVVTNDDDALDALVARTGATVIETVDPVASNVEHPRLALLRVDTARVDVSTFVADVTALAEARQIRARGAYRISSARGVALLALAAAEARAGHVVAVNFVAEPMAIPGSTAEAPTGPAGYTPDAYAWPHMGRDTIQSFGVTDAWDLLSWAERRGNHTTIAVLDGGFAALADLPSDLEELGDTLGHENDGTCTGGRGCPWHGTNVTSTAMAVPDDGLGVAGSSGGLGRPLVARVPYDLATASFALIAAHGRGARIANMSFGARLPAIVSWAALPFESVTTALAASGMVLFAAAGNDGANVDAEDCIGDLCWEEAWHTPCENAGVTCVGGLAWDSTARAPDSNYGAEDVDLYGPYTVYVGPDPSAPAPDVARTKNGTSFSSPFAAGVAALVWAADPTLPASEIRRIMHDGAHQAEGRSERWLDAYHNVLYVLRGVVRPTVTAPLPDDVPEAGLPLTLSVSLDVTFWSHADVTCTARWSSTPGGPLGEGTVTIENGTGTATVVVTAPALDPGAHTLALAATCTNGADTITRTVERTIDVHNTAPSVRIESPAAGATVCRDALVLLRGSATDVNEPAGLSNSAFSWSSSIDGALGTGRVVTTSDLAIGTHRLTLTVHDRWGAFASSTIALVVLSPLTPACVDYPPTAVINAPADGAWFAPDGRDDLDWYVELGFEGSAFDHEDAVSALIIEWYSNREGLLGRGLGLTRRLHAVGGVTTEHTITLRVRDTAGHVTEDHVRVLIEVLF